MAGKVFTTNAGHIALRFRKRAEAIPKALEDAERETLKRAKKLAEEHSSGTAYKMGRDKPAPYSRRENRPPGDPAIANVQRGRLRRGWRTKTTRTGKGITGTLYNVDRAGRFFTGKATRTMIARPLLQSVNKQIAREKRKLERQAVNKALRKP
jgi:hypothetical protein